MNSREARTIKKAREDAENKGFGAGASSTAVFLVMAIILTVGRADTREVWVELEDMTGLDAESIRTLKSEVEEIYSAAGVDVLWISGGTGGEAHYARVFIMDELPGSLVSRIRAFRRGTPMALILGDSPNIYISRRQVAAKAVGAVGLEPDLEILGRALGRVLGHELAHRFVDMNHSRRGILKANLGQGDLIAGNIQAMEFLPDQLEKLQRVAHRP